jgi:hypothetical protein
MLLVRKWALVVLTFRSARRQKRLLLGQDWRCVHGATEGVVCWWDSSLREEEEANGVSHLGFLERRVVMRCESGRAAGRATRTTCIVLAAFP